MSILKVKDINGNIIDIPAIRGYSAYQSAVANGFKGTVEEWLDSLKGDPYNLTDEDINIIRSQVVITLTPTMNEFDTRIDNLEAADTNFTDRLGILETAVKNLSGLKIVKVDTIEAITEENIIYLLPSEDGTYYYEYLVYNGKPEIVGNTDIDLSNYVSKDELATKAKFYRHNVSLQYSHSNSTFETKGTDGRFMATFVLENTDPTPYSFTHNYGGTSAVVMEKDIAWQFLRLYYAMQLSTNKDEAFRRPCSGSVITVDSNYKAQRGFLETITTLYSDPTDADWTRYVKVFGMDCDSDSLSDKTVTIPCGHPKFDTNGNEIKWTNVDEFYSGEFQAVTSSGSGRYKSYFCQHRLYCNDYVEEVNLVLD